MVDLFFALLNLSVFGGIIAFLFFRYGVPLVHLAIAAEKESVQKRTEKQTELSADLLAQKKQYAHNVLVYSELEQKVAIWQASLSNEKEKNAQAFCTTFNKRQENRALRARACALLVVDREILPAALNKARKNLKAAYSSPQRQELVLKTSINKIKQL